MIIAILPLHTLNLTTGDAQPFTLQIGWVVLEGKFSMKPMPNHMDGKSDFIIKLVEAQVPNVHYQHSWPAGAIGINAATYWTKEWERG